MPSYVFGQTQFFNQLSTSSGLASRVSRAMRMSLTIFWGRFGLPIPFQAPVTMVFGRPLDMTGDPDVDLQVRPAWPGVRCGGAAAAVAYCVQRWCILALTAPTSWLLRVVLPLHPQNYITALRALFEKYKGYAGYGDKVLHIR